MHRARVPAALVLLACVLGIGIAGPAHAAPVTASHHAHRHLAGQALTPVLLGPTDTHRVSPSPDALPGVHEPSDPLTVGAASSTDGSTSIGRTAPAPSGRDPPPDV